MQTVDPYRYGVRVVGVVIFGHQYGVNLLADGFLRRGISGEALQFVLAEGFAYDFQSLISAEENGLSAIHHPSGPFPPGTIVARVGGMGDFSWFSAK